MRLSLIFVLLLKLLLAPAHAEPQATTLASAVFAGGCFWSVEADFKKLPGVIKIEPGYTGGQVKNPTYEQVSSGTSGHAEVVRITYDASKLTYAKLLDYFWHHIDPTTQDQQFCDFGAEYRTAIYYQNEEQRVVAERSKVALEQSGRLLRLPPPTPRLNTNYPPEFLQEGQERDEAAAQERARKNPGHIYTEILPASTFYPAEEYHQDYAAKNPIRYKMYRIQCGRDARLQQIWGR